MSTGKPKLSLVGGEKSDTRRQDMRDVLNFTQKMVAESELESLIIITQAEGEAPMLQAVNFQELNALGTLAYVGGLILQEQFLPHPTDEEPSGDDAPSEG